MAWDSFESRAYWICCVLILALQPLAYLLQGILDMLRAYIGTSTASVFSVCVRLAFSTVSGNRTPPGRALVSLVTNHYATPPSNR
ncbi:hypothetical protein T12_11028 [Trichinella patagoniensis]|uniref:Uncharacterized protein n=1 Tax=Trichinella patagoniensis TaxID=990121 RepID=A0A0V0YYG7_9BILA|nr:hypothetical protein T12_336 [Trichinella patagoniensis]KRY22262.1 hypothetical protein T12_11028 [Trichinella patagoniensis]